MASSSAKLNIEWFLSLAYVYMQNQHYEESLALLKLVLLLNRKDTRALKLMGFLYYKMGDGKRAYSSIKRWLEVARAGHEETAKMYLLQSKVLLRLKKKTHAKKALVQYTEFMGRADEEKRKLAEMLEERKQKAKARSRKRR